MPDFLNADRPPVPQLVVPTAMQPFHLEGRPVRGRLVRLGALADALLSRHDYSPPWGGWWARRLPSPPASPPR